ncbi:VOC family protein [Thalassococcus sp. CAU 1522]|uniref:VOC family protein n=1 Tax=Thalassococcus arenae TaxID=2851652 RepID=A0ABS6NBE7_9RHOB|nr:VOC family protein [Thalassococcus arenae]MBV2361345.1 VOC family protein [Thalassococcus arenae]
MLIPATRYRDCEAALRFINDVLNLPAHAVYRDDAGRIQHAQIALGAGLMMFGPPNDGPFDRYMADPGDIGGRETTTIYAVLPDRATLQAHYDRARAAGAEILMPLEDQPYGGANFTLADPEGHIWSFGDYDPRAEA